MSVLQHPARRDEPGPGRRPRAAGHVAMAITVALVGFLLATQLRSVPPSGAIGERLAIERETDLVRILSDLSARSDQLLEEIIELRVQLAAAAGSAAQDEILIENARGELRSLQILLGIVPVEGQGIVITIRDPLRSVGAEVLVDTIQELRDAGAEALELNGVRVVASTAIAGTPGDLAAGGEPIAPPFRIAAVGARQTLAEAMRIPGGIADSIRSRPGAAIDIAERETVRITSLHRIPTFTYARPSDRR